MEPVPELPVYGFSPDLGGLLGVVILVVLPILVGLLTRVSTSAAVKGVLLLAIAAVKVIVESALEAVNTGVDWEFVPVLYTVLLNFAIAVTVHFGLWKPTGTTSASQRVLVKDSANRG